MNAHQAQVALVWWHLTQQIALAWPFAERIAWCIDHDCACTELTTWQFPAPNEVAERLVGSKGRQLQAPDSVSC